jgi:hypothetical protein
VKILRFGEEIRLTLIVDGFAQPVVESWRVGHQLLPPNASSQPVYTSVISTVTAIVRPPAPALARLDKTTQFAVASLVVTTSGSSIAISAAPGAGRFELPVEAIVRDAAELPGVPAAVRVARGTVTFDGERIEYDDNYVHDAEGCWLRRLQRGTRYLERYEPGPIAPPPWLKQADSMLIPRMKERQLVPRPGPRRSEMKPKGPGQ